MSPGEASPGEANRLMRSGCTSPALVRTPHRSVSMAKVIALFTVVLAAACTTSKTPNARGGGPASQTTVEEGAMAYAAEACAREKRCGRVGEGKQLSGGEACRSSFEHIAMQGLAVCDSRRVNASLLVDCMESIRASSCDADVQAACGYVEMCAP